MPNNSSPPPKPGVRSSPNNTKDFLLLHDAWTIWSAAWRARTAAQHAGILIIYPTTGLNAQLLADEIDRLATMTGDFANRLFQWHLSDGWTETF